MSHLEHEFQQDDFVFAHGKEEKLIDKISIVSVADVFADAINFVHKGESISSLFD